MTHFSPCSEAAARDAYETVVVARWVARLCGRWFSINLMLLGAALLLFLPAWWGGGVAIVVFGAVCLALVERYARTRARMPFARLVSDAGRLGVQTGVATPVILVLIPVVTLGCAMLTGGPTTPEAMRRMVLVAVVFEAGLLPVWAPSILGMSLRRRIVAHHFAAHPDEAAAIHAAWTPGAMPADVFERLAIDDALRDYVARGY